MYENILQTAQNTPLVRLSRVGAPLNHNVFAKLEGFNPGGSMKDRPAFNMIANAVESGGLDAGAAVVESSSGNMGIGLAQACAYFGLRFICVVDPKTTAQHVNILKAYGAEVELVLEPDPETGEFLPARLRKVQELLDRYPGSFWPNQYANQDNPAAHYRTMGEIANELQGKVHYVFCATSTCGSIRGYGEYLKEHGMPTRLIAVDAVGSVLFCGHSGTRLIPGHGAGMVPPLYRPGLAEKCIKVSDLECIVGCRDLVRKESILAGGSSGAVFSAFERMKNEVPAGANCVLIFADRGERYLDTIYSDRWVEQHFGDVSYLWNSHPHALQQCAKFSVPA